MSKDQTKTTDPGSLDPLGWAATDRPCYNCAGTGTNGGRAINQRATGQPAHARGQRGGGSFLREMQRAGCRADKNGCS
jgi:hypothetical protein